MNKMNIEEYNKVKDYTYEKYCNYLKKKYGKSMYPYFMTNWSRHFEVSRTKEGLFCHHIKEDTACKLSEPEIAKEWPYEYQLPENLVYCDWLEHLFLHILISEESYELKQNQHTQTIETGEIFENVGVGGIFNYFVPWLNDIYSGFCPEQRWQQNCRQKIINDRDTYLELIRRIAFYENVYYPYTVNQLLGSFNGHTDQWHKSTNARHIEPVIKAITTFKTDDSLEDSPLIVDIKKLVDSMSDDDTNWCCKFISAHLQIKITSCTKASLLKALKKCMKKSVLVNIYAFEGEINYYSITGLSYLYDYLEAIPHSFEFIKNLYINEQKTHEGATKILTNQSLEEFIQTPSLNNAINNYIHHDTADGSDISWGISSQFVF